MPVEHQTWRDQAVCKDLDFAEIDTIFFLGKGKNPQVARKFCGQCPVQQECLDYAILYGERGIWAGTTDKERDAIAPMMRPLLQAKAISEGTYETRDSSDWLVVLPQAQTFSEEWQQAG